MTDFHVENLKQKSVTEIKKNKKNCTSTFRREKKGTVPRQEKHNVPGSVLVL